MGISLCRLAKIAAEKAGISKNIYAVSRFSDKDGKEKLESWGIKTITCDLLNEKEVRMLPLTENVIFMAGRKFGTLGSEPLTWAMNTLVPANCASHYKNSRIVAFSTGCIYPLVSTSSGGSIETDHPEPVGEYAQSCLMQRAYF